jgi:hypothetical protein
MTFREMVTTNMGLKALSLAAAVVLWFLVSYEKVATETLQVPVSLSNLASDLVIVEEGPKTLEIEVSGPKLKLLSLNRKLQRVTLDLKGLGEGTVSFPVPGQGLQLPPDVKVTRLYPAEVKLRLGRRQAGN